MAKKHPYTETILPNKLKVLLYPMKSVMSTYAVLFVRVGAVYEEQKQRGLSHFTEHAAFLGTKKHPSPLLASREAQRIGTRFNGRTDRFSTHYWVSLPYTNIKDGLNLLHQFVFEPKLTKSDIKKEKGVILSEYNDFWHDPERRFSHESWRKRFRQKEHPYSYRALGIPETIKSIEKKDILSWRKKYYTPANMILAVTGNVKKNEIINYLGANFGKEQRGVKKEEPKFNTQDYSKYTFFYQKEPRPQIKFYISFPSFGRKEVDRKKRVRLALLNNIFGVGWASRLFQELREKERLVYRVRSFTNLHTWMGNFGVSGSVPVEKLTPAMKILRNEIDKLSANGVTQEEIALFRNYMNALTLMRFDNPESIAYYFGYQVFDEEKIWFPEDYIRESKKIKKSELDRLAKDLIDYSRVNISLFGNIPPKKLKAVADIFKFK